MNPLARLFRRFHRAENGAAAVEMSLIGMVLMGALFNAVEIGRYGIALMQVNHAAQAGVAAAYRACDTEHLPATQNCGTLASVVGTAIASTSLGSDISLQGQVTEGWYCVSDAHQLQYVAAPSAKPANCAVVNGAGSPGLYLGVRARYSYEPVFHGMTIAGSFATPIDRTAWARMQ